MNPTVNLSTPGGVTLALLPELILCACALGVLLVVSWRHQTAADSRLVGWLSLASLVATAAALAWLAASGTQSEGIPQMVALDKFRYAGSALILLSAAVTVVLSIGYLEREGLFAPEYYVLLLLATAGLMFMVGAQDLIVIFLGLETMSVAVYVLSGYDRRSAFSAEAGLKYFLIGAFASGFLLYGIALVYGTAGTTNLVQVGAQLAGGDVPVMAALGLGLLVIGFGFKIAAVPFHMWAPDVYDGAPTPVTGFMATAVKAAGFITLARVLTESFPGAIHQWQPIVAALAVATMVLGNLVALAQLSLKRMLAYSSIAHAGYLLVAVWPGTGLGTAAMLFYLFGYALTSLVAFGLLAMLGQGGERDVTLQDLAGLGATRPALALGMSVCMLSLLGFPGTIGFIGKWYILSALVAEQHAALGVVLVVTSLISAGYYLPVVMTMYMRPPRAPRAHSEAVLSPPLRLALTLAVVAILLFGVWPTSMLHTAEESAASLVQIAAESVSGQ